MAQKEKPAEDFTVYEKMTAEALNYDGDDGPPPDKISMSSMGTEPPEHIDQQELMEEEGQGGQQEVVVAASFIVGGGSTDTDTTTTMTTTMMTLPQKNESPKLSNSVRFKKVRRFKRDLSSREMDEDADADENKSCRQSFFVCCPDQEGSSSGRVNVSPQQRLPIHMKMSVDKLRARLPPRPEAIPKTYLPSWQNLPLTTKLPRVPAPPGTIIFSRGTVAKPLLRNNQNFTLNDPFGLERVPMREYNALHDVHACSYFDKPGVRKLLIRQGLVSCNNEVLCSQKEFNQFRTYLASIQNDQLNGVLSDAHQRWLNDREQVLRLLKYQSMQTASGRDYNRWLKVKNAERKNKQRQAAMAKRIEEKKDADANRASKYEAEKQRQLLNRKILTQERDRIVAERRQRKMERDLQSRQRLLAHISMKDAAVQNRVEEEKEFLRRAYEQFLLEWLEAKYHFQEENNPKMAALEKTIESNLKQKAAERQVKVELYRERIPEILEERKKKEQYIFQLTKKYFYRWLNKVRERKSRKPDALHQSLWDAVSILNDQLKYLQKESGYEKLDDLILNVIKLKTEIKLKLAEEEASNKDKSIQGQSTSSSSAPDDTGVSGSLKD